MMITDQELRLIEATQEGLPLVPRPYEQVGRGLAMSEAQVLDGLQSLIDRGVIKRFGVIVRHRRLGYRANLMAVWDVPDDRVDAVGRSLGQVEYVTLCYQRPRRLPDWPYNLFTMIHGRDRQTVLDQWRDLAARSGLLDIPRAALFSRRCFKQRGAHYRPAGPLEAVA